MPWKFKVPAGPGGMRLPGLGGSSSGGSSSGGFGGSGIPGIPSPSSGSPSGSGVPGWGDWVEVYRTRHRRHGRRLLCEQVAHRRSQEAGPDSGLSNAPFRLRSPHESDDGEYVSRH